MISYRYIIYDSSISNLRYTDDTALIEGSHEKKGQLTNSVNEVGKNLHLKLSVKKTKVLVAGRTKTECNIVIGGEKVE